MAITKKQCINDPAFSYTGKEYSPLGLGYCASAEQVGTMMKGKDSTMWMVGMKNGVKVWNRIPTEVSTPLQKEEPLIKEDAQQPALENADKKVVEKEDDEEEDRTMDNSTVASTATDKEKKPRAPTKFNVFMRLRMHELTSSNPDLNHREKFSMAASEWKQMSKVEQEEYLRDHNVDDLPPPKPKKATTKAKPTPAEAPAEEEPKAKKVTTKAKPTPAEEEPKEEKKTRAPTQFNIFMRLRMRELSSSNPKLAHQEKFSTVASEWKKMSKDERAQYLSSHAE